MSHALLERLEISELVQSWALYRDTGDWDKLRQTVHADGIMTATWFHGTFDDFITAIQ
ncbi:MAG: nuclear transport factor 2 family protein, partial [Betaproteobacteria bacterium]|nr:nuclear transport factor 2 family protein [Betaproteobacteria bacterium]